MTASGRVGAISCEASWPCVRVVAAFAGWEDMIKTDAEVNKPLRRMIVAERLLLRILRIR